MKITAILLLATCMQIHAKTLAQTISLSEKNAPLKKVLKEIKKQIGVAFFYDEALLKISKSVNIEVRNETLEEVLEKVFQKQDLTYEVIGNKIITIRERDTRLTVASSSNPTVLFVDTTIRGTVKDYKGAPMVGVSVNLKGTTRSAITDGDGKYSIKVTGSRPTLVFSYVGHKEVAQIVGSAKVVNINMEAEAKDLSDVVVVGYGTQKRINAIGAISTIGTKELVQSPVANISNSLVGRLPGLFATQSGGEPGNDASTIKIRGVATFTGSTDPLVLVDGIEVANYNNLDPNEIESLTILKDASSTAVYGIRGANGVIIITTKRGKLGPPKVSYTFSKAYNSFTDLRKTIDGAEYAIGFNAALKGDAYAANSVYTPRFTESEIELYRSGKDPVFYPNIDWYEKLFRKVSTQSQHNLSISGGQKKVKYFISAGFFNQTGLFKDTRHIVEDFSAQSVYKRYNLRSNFNFDVTDNFKITLDLSTQTEARTGNNAGSTERIIGDIARASPIDGPGVYQGKIVYLKNSGGNNPFVSLLFPNGAGGFKRSYRNYYNSSLRFDHDMSFITKGLAVHGTASLQTYNDQTITNAKTVITYTASRLSDGSINLVPSTTSKEFSFSQAGTDNRRITSEVGIDYKRKFGDHSVTGLLLYNQQKTFNRNLAFLVPKGYQSYVGRVTYDYKTRYLAEVDLGYNGTENFAPGKRFGWFPAYSLGWVVSNEPFFPGKGIISFLKFRGSYGEVGNDAIGGNRFLYNPTSYTTVGSIYYFGNVGTNRSAYNGLLEGLSGNPDITWERSIKQNIAVEMRSLKDKLKISLDLFKETRNNIISVPQTITAAVGISQPFTNLGIMENKGYEIELNYSDMIGKFGYRIGGNLSFARNKVVYRDELPRLYSYQNQTGQRLGQPFVVIADGIYNTWEEVNDPKRPVYQGNNRIQPGDLKFRDVNSDGIVNSFDAVPYGNPNLPEKTFGLSLGGTYQGFDLSVLFQGVGNVSLTYTRFQRYVAYGETVPAGGPDYLISSWTPERYAAGLPIEFPRPTATTTTATNANFLTSSFYVADASYFRLKNLELGYTLRASLLKKIGISSSRLYVNGNNLITWKHVRKGIDPENTAAASGNDEPYPLVRTMNVGFNINF